MLRRLGLDPNISNQQPPADDASSHYSLRPRRRRRPDAPEPRGAETSKPPKDANNTPLPIPMQSDKSISLRPSQASRANESIKPSSPAARDTPALRLPAPSAATTSAIAARPGLVSVANLEDASTVTLQALCKKVGLPATGTKEDIRDRLLAKVSQRRFLNEDTLIMDSDGNPRALSTMPVTPPNTKRATTTSMILDAQGSPGTVKKNAGHVTTTTIVNRTPRRGSVAHASGADTGGGAPCATKVIAGGVTAKGGPGGVVAKSGCVDMKKESRSQPNTRSYQEPNLRLDISSRAMQGVDVAGNSAGLPALSSTGIGAPYDMPMSPAYEMNITRSACCFPQTFPGGPNGMYGVRYPKERNDPRGNGNISMKEFEPRNVATETVFRDLAHGNRRLSQGEYEACLKALNENYTASAEKRNVRAAALLSRKGVPGTAATVPRSSLTPGPSDADVELQLQDANVSTVRESSPSIREEGESGFQKTRLALPAPPNAIGDMSSSALPSASGTAVDFKSHPAPFSATAGHAADVLRTSQPQPPLNLWQGEVRYSSVNPDGTTTAKGGAGHDMSSERNISATGSALGNGNGGRSKPKEFESRDPFQHRFSGAVGGPGAHNGVGRATFDVERTAKPTGQITGAETPPDIGAFGLNRAKGGRFTSAEDEMYSRSQFTTPRDVVRSFNRYGSRDTDAEMKSGTPEPDSPAGFASPGKRPDRSRRRESTRPSTEETLPTHLRGFTSTRKLGVASSRRRSMNQSAVQSGRIMRLPTFGARRPASTNSGGLLPNLPRSNAMAQRSNFLAQRVQRRSIQNERSPNPPLSAKSLRILEEIRKVRNENRSHSTSKRTRSPAPVPPSALKRARINGQFTRSPQLSGRPMGMDAQDAMRAPGHMGTSHGPARLRADDGNDNGRSRLSRGLRVTPTTSKRRRPVVFGSGKKRSRPSSLSAVALKALKSTAKNDIDSGKQHNKRLFSLAASEESGAGDAKVVRGKGTARLTDRPAGDRFSLPAVAFPPMPKVASGGSSGAHEINADSPEGFPETSDTLQGGRGGSGAVAGVFKLSEQGQGIETVPPPKLKLSTAAEKEDAGFLQKPLAVGSSDISLPSKVSGEGSAFGGAKAFVFGDMKPLGVVQSGANDSSGPGLSSNIVPSKSTSQTALVLSADSYASQGALGGKGQLGSASKSRDQTQGVPDVKPSLFGDGTSRGSLLAVAKADVSERSDKNDLSASVSTAGVPVKEKSDSVPRFILGDDLAKADEPFTGNLKHDIQTGSNSLPGKAQTAGISIAPTDSAPMPAQTAPTLKLDDIQTQRPFERKSGNNDEIHPSANAESPSFAAQENKIDTPSLLSVPHPSSVIPSETTAQKASKKPTGFGFGVDPKPDLAPTEKRHGYRALHAPFVGTESRKDEEQATRPFEAAPSHTTGGPLGAVSLGTSSEAPVFENANLASTTLPVFASQTGNDKGGVGAVTESGSGLDAGAMLAKQKALVGIGTQETGNVVKASSALPTAPFSFFGKKTVDTTEGPTPSTQQNTKVPDSEPAPSSGFGNLAGASSGPASSSGQPSGGFAFGPAKDLQKDPGPFGGTQFTSLPPATNTAKFVFGAPSSQANAATSGSGFAANASGAGIREAPSFGSTFQGLAGIGQKTTSLPGSSQASASGADPALNSGAFGSAGSAPFRLTTGGTGNAASSGALGITDGVKFGTDSSAAIGTASTASFGAKSSEAFGASGGAFGAMSGSAFGASSGGVFGAPSGGAFGTSSGNAFGAAGVGTFPTASSGPFNAGKPGAFAAASGGALQGSSGAAFGDASGVSFGSTKGATFGSASLGAFGATGAQAGASVQFGAPAAALPGGGPVFGGLPGSSTSQPGFAAPTFGFGAPVTGQGGTASGFGSSFGQSILQTGNSNAPSGSSGPSAPSFSFGSNGANGAPPGGAFNIGAAPNTGQQPARRGRRTLRARRMLR